MLPTASLGQLTLWRQYLLRASKSNIPYWSAGSSLKLLGSENYVSKQIGKWNSITHTALGHWNEGFLRYDKQHIQLIIMKFELSLVILKDKYLGIPHGCLWGLTNSIRSRSGLIINHTAAYLYPMSSIMLALGTSTQTNSISDTWWNKFRHVRYLNGNFTLFLV